MTGPARKETGNGDWKKEERRHKEEGFRPDFTHQLFDEERIKGFKEGELTIRVVYTPTSLDFLVKIQTGDNDDARCFTTEKATRTSWWPNPSPDGTMREAGGHNGSRSSGCWLGLQIDDTNGGVWRGCRCLVPTSSAVLVGLPRAVSRASF